MTTEEAGGDGAATKGELLKLPLSSEGGAGVPSVLGLLEVEICDSSVSSLVNSIVSMMEEIKTPLVEGLTEDGGVDEGEVADELAAGFVSSRVDPEREGVDECPVVEEASLWPTDRALERLLYSNSDSLCEPSSSSLLTANVWRFDELAWPSKPLPPDTDRFVRL